MSVATDVRYFDSSMIGMVDLAADDPQSLIDLFQVTLMGGAPAHAISSAEVVGGVVTITMGEDHGFKMFGAYGPVVELAGYDNPALNDTFRVTGTPDTTSFTVALPGGGTFTPSGTSPTMKLPGPGGWEVVDNDIVNHVFAIRSTEGSGVILKVEDLGQNQNAWIYATQSEYAADSNNSWDVDETYFSKSNSTTLARSWRLYTDRKTFYLFSDSTGATLFYSSFAFGDFIVGGLSDAYASFLIGHTTSSYASGVVHNLSNETGHLLARSYTVTEGAVLFNAVSYGTTATVGGSLELYPCPATGKTYVWPIAIVEDASKAMRGFIPGMWNPGHDGNLLSDLEVAQGSLASPEKTFVMQTIRSDSNKVAFDIVGPWQ